MKLAIPMNILARVSMYYQHRSVQMTEPWNKAADLKPDAEVPACQPTQECDVAGCEASAACAPETPKTA